MSFWGVNDARLWEPHQIRYAATIPPNTSLHFVAYVDGTVRGVEAMSGGVHVDGGSVPIEDELRGEHAVWIVVHRDADRDEAFDPETDPPCYNDDGLVGTRHLVVDLDHYW